MSAKFAVEEIIEITGGRLAQGMMPDGAGQISTDTRNISETDWYLAMSGELYDGHNFLGDAYSAGALGAIVAERPSYPIANNSFPLIAVEDTLAAYQALARAWRFKVSPAVVGVTGSSGKTTTKEMCASVFAASMRTHKSQANENNEVGVAKTILAMPADTEVLIIELAMRARGEIAALTKIALPDVGIIVNAGVAHIGILSSVDNIVAAKCELLEEMSTVGGVAVIGQQNELLIARAQSVFGDRMLVWTPESVRELQVTPEKTVFAVGASEWCNKESKFSVRAHGLSQLQDAWCAIMAARECGVDDESIARGLMSYNPVSGRGTKLVAKCGCTVVDEAYNGNPDSVRSSVCSFVDERVFPQPEKYVVLGELAELGQETDLLHRELGRWLRDKKLTALLTVGPVACHIAEGAEGAAFEVIACQDQKEVEDALRPRLTAQACVLIKGSHCANLDRLVATLVVPAVENCST